MVQNHVNINFSWDTKKKENDVHAWFSIFHPQMQGCKTSFLIVMCTFNRTDLERFCSSKHDMIILWCWKLDKHHF